jgi:hypothetical protein
VPDNANQSSADWRYERYDVSLKFDNPEARIAHEFFWTIKAPK